MNVKRISKLIGGWLANATYIATGYLWATHGLLYAFAFWGGMLVISLAILGAFSLGRDRA